MDTDPPSLPRRRALAFPGGGFDTAMQLGVAHAILVARGVPPDYVVGISAGALNATALAEILQANPSELSQAERRLKSDDELLAYRVDKLRTFLDAWIETPGELLRAIAPDGLEIIAKDPLDPIELPIHFRGERKGRDAANRSRAGLIGLIDRIFHIDIPVATATRLIRRFLGIAEAMELGIGAKSIAMLRNVIGILWTFVTDFASIAPLLGSMAWSALAGPNREILREFQHAIVGRTTAGRVIARFRAARLLLHGLKLLMQALIAVFLLPFTPLAFSARVRRWLAGPVFSRLLAYYDIGRGIGNTDVVRQRIIQCFDPHYFGKTNITSILDRALERSDCPQTGSDNNRKRLSIYTEVYPPIRVIPVAADVATGHLTAMPPYVPVVDALLAATAATPVFPAVRIDFDAEQRRAKMLELDPNAAMSVDDSDSGMWFIDGVNVSNAPLGPLLNVLRDDLARSSGEPGALDVYPVSDLPLTAGKLPSDKPDVEYKSLLDVVVRSLELKRLRDATLEYRLTGLYSRFLPAGQMSARIGEKVFVKANLFPLELERPVRMNQRLVLGTAGSFREAIYQTVADGCRASLEGMMPSTVKDSAGDSPQVLCRTAMTRRLGRSPSIPGSDGTTGPGLSEICSNCALLRKPDGKNEHPQSLVARKRPPEWPEWPTREQEWPAATLSDPVTRESPKPTEGWPAKRGEQEGAERPLINLLFGGGVFRGVFHMGVMNALDQLRLKPDIVAGSSVGSIVAAMIAQVFSEGDRQRRDVQIARLASTFLAIDKLVLTDRLADFVRRLTLHAAQTDFSPRDLDRVFRRYDRDSMPRFDERLRRVLAGIERLTYVSPFELLDLVRNLRLHRWAELARDLRVSAEDFLERSGIGMEILGSEPLSLLIEAHVLDNIKFTSPQSRGLFASFLDSGIHFLATATNLHTGELEILGEDRKGGLQEPTLRYGLLASSAFPGVFRPRQAWEISRPASNRHQYADGGTIDNLPLYAVAQFLDRQSNAGYVARRPVVGEKKKNVPHLVFTASLEIDVRTESDDSKLVGKLVRNCLELFNRAQKFGYNRKVDAYQAAQKNLRQISKSLNLKGPLAPLDLEVVVVKPQWLCGTFGFHSMLGFRRQKQAESIAHGCASTIAMFAQIQRESPDWLAAWGIDASRLDLETILLFEGVRGTERRVRAALRPNPKPKPGACYFQREAICPFSADALEQLRKTQGNAITLAMESELMKIYDACGRNETHTRAGETPRFTPRPNENKL